tara:strand:- start:81 stop:221 length:141 start_codon:yes stop_codon:yes gene_type:complete
MGLEDGNWLLRYHSQNLMLIVPLASYQLMIWHDKRSCAFLILLFKL